MKYTNKLHIFKFLALALCIVVVGLIGISACSAGAAGAPGKSAYDIWLEQGNTGTEQDFLDSLKGDKGDQGIQGSKGDKGDPGDKPEITVGNNGNWYVDGVDTGVKAQGNQGIQGPQGDPGAAGKNGPSWFSGAKCPNEDKDIGQYAQGSVRGDFYICAECGYLWKSNGDGTWKKICCLKGPKGDKGDPAESGGDPGFALNVSAGEKAEMPIALSAGVYVVEVATDQKILVGKLTANVDSIATTSEFAFSQTRTDNASNGTFVYYGYVIVAEGDLKLTFAPSADLEMWDRTKAIKDAKVSITKWEQPTLKADGVPVEVPVNGYVATGDKLLKVTADSSIVAGSYLLNIKENETALTSVDTVGIFDQAENFASRDKIGYCGRGDTDVTFKANLANDFLIFKIYQGSSNDFIRPALVTLTVKQA